MLSCCFFCQSDYLSESDTDRHQCAAVCATAIMSFYGANCPVRLRAVRGKMLMAPPVPPVSLHHLSDCSQGDWGGAGGDGREKKGGGREREGVVG